MKKILVVDDSVTNLDIIVRYLNTVGNHDARPVFSGLAAKKEIARDDFDLLIFDLLLVDIDGLELLRWTRGAGVVTPVLLVSAIGAQELREVGEQAEKEGLGPIGVVSKACKPPSLLLDAIERITA